MSDLTVDTLFSYYMLYCGEFLGLRKHYILSNCPHVFEDFSGFVTYLVG